MSEGKGRRVHIPISDLCHLCLQGVVPYLGTFLKDLVMLDAASKDELEVSVCVCVCDLPWVVQHVHLRDRQTAFHRKATGRRNRAISRVRFCYHGK